MSEADSLLASHVFHVVTLLQQRLEILRHTELNQFVVPLIDRLHLIRAPCW